MSACFAHSFADLGISRIAGRQHGLIGARQLAALGFGRGAVADRVATGRLHRIHAGVFALGHSGISSEARLLAAVIAWGSAAVLSHDHAAHLWELLPPWSELDLAAIQVTVPPACGRGRRAGIAAHRHSLAPEDCVERRAIPVTSPARPARQLFDQPFLVIADLSSTLTGRRPST